MPGYFPSRLLQMGIVGERGCSDTGQLPPLPSGRKYATSMRDTFEAIDSLRNEFYADFDSDEGVLKILVSDLGESASVELSRDEVEKLRDFLTGLLNR